MSSSVKILFHSFTLTYKTTATTRRVQILQVARGIRTYVHTYFHNVAVRPMRLQKHHHLTV